METGEWVHGGWRGEVGEWEGVVAPLQWLGFSSWSVFVFWMIIHVFSSDSFSFINERTFLQIR